MAPRGRIWLTRRANRDLATVEPLARVALWAFANDNPHYIGDTRFRYYVDGEADASIEFKAPPVEVMRATALRCTATS